MCDHAHDKSSFCNLLKDTLKKVKLNLSEANLDEEDRNDVMYSFQQAYTAIEAWKAHQRDFCLAGPPFCFLRRQKITRRLLARFYPDKT